MKVRRHLTDTFPIEGTKHEEDHLCLIQPLDYPPYCNQTALRSPCRIPLRVHPFRALLIWLTVGVAGAVLFTTTYVIEGATRPGYDGWQQAISALSLGPGGWLQQANFVVLGVCTLCMAVAWRTVLTGGGLVAMRRIAFPPHPESLGVSGRWTLAVRGSRQDRAEFAIMG